MFNNKKGQTAGLITGLVFGIASLVIGVIIAFVIVSTLIGAGLLDSGRTSSGVNNETSAWLNNSGYQLAEFKITNHINPVIVYLRNGSNGLVPSITYSISSTGLLTNSTINDTYIGNAKTMNVTYTYTVRTNEEVSANMLSTNFTKGVNNISSKIPTVLLVAAIVLILGVLAVLVGVWQRMRMGGGTSL